MPDPIVIMVLWVVGEDMMKTLFQSLTRAYVSQIINDVGNKMKKSGVYLDLQSAREDNILEIYTQVVYGLNVCLSTQLATEACTDGAKKCDYEERRCSILIGKPPGAESNIEVHCDHPDNRNRLDVPLM